VGSISVPSEAQTKRLLTTLVQPFLGFLLSQHAFTLGGFFFVRLQELAARAHARTLTILVGRRLIFFVLAASAQQCCELTFTVAFFFGDISTGEVQDMHGAHCV
jgi:hypothetical protein